MSWKKSEIYQTLTKLQTEDNRLVHKKYEDDRIHSIQFDSRKIIQSDCFIAISGLNNDGHQFVNQAYRSGAKIAIVEHPVESEIEQIVVKDSLLALHELALYWRQKFDLTIIAITGSNGKTTTKHILANILDKKAPTLSTYKNFNNEFGVPLTLFELQEKHRYGVIEIGATKFHDIEKLARLVLADISIVTNINETHLKSFQSIENIAKTKSEIYTGLKPGGVAVVNLDEPFNPSFKEIIAKKEITMVSFSTQSRQGDVYASNVVISPKYIKFNLMYGNQSTVIETRKILGSHNLSNLLAACCICYVLKIPITTLKTALESSSAAENRLDNVGSNDCIYLIDDTYNANPAATEKAIEFLDMYDNPKIMVMGDMSELGNRSEFHHCNIGKILEKSDIDLVLLYGDKVQLTKEVCKRAKYFSDINRVNEYLKGVLQSSNRQYSILVKGSRVMRMERVVNFLKDEFL